MNGVDFDRAYDYLAAALDRVGPQHETAFLTRLALLLAHDCADLAAYARALDAAVQAGEDGNPSP